MSIEEIREFCIRVMSTPEKFNKSTFQGRLNFGIAAEALVLVAMERGIIENYPTAVAAPPVNPDDKWSIKQNAMNGDIYFYSKNSNNNISGMYECLDVKGTNFIAHASLGVFRRDGWYFLNALVESPSMAYIMIRNNDAFQKYISDNMMHVEDTVNNGVRLNFSDIPPDPRAYGLDMYPKVDAAKYLRLVQELKRAVQDVCPNLIKFVGKDPDTKITFKVDHLKY